MKLIDWNRTKFEDMVGKVFMLENSADYFMVGKYEGDQALFYNMNTGEVYDFDMLFDKEMFVYNENDEDFRGVWEMDKDEIIDYKNIRTVSAQEVKLSQTLNLLDDFGIKYEIVEGRNNRKEVRFIDADGDDMRVSSLNFYADGDTSYSYI